MTEPAAPITPPVAAVDADAEIVAARAARDAAESSPFTLESTRQAAEGRFVAAYQAKHGSGPASTPLAAPPASTSPAVGIPIAPSTSLTVETAPGKIAALRKELATVTDARRHDALLNELHAAYKVLDAEPAGETPPASASTVPPEGTVSEPEPDRLPDLPAGFRWDTAAVMDVYQVAEREGLPRAAFHEGLALAAQLAAGPMPTSEQAEVTLREKWGGDYDAELKAARSVVKRLPARVLDYLDDTGLGDHPAMIEHFANLSAKLKAGG